MSIKRTSKLFHPSMALAIVLSLGLFAAGPLAAQNSPPVAADDSATTPQDTPVVIDAAANDFDADGNLDPYSAVAITAPANASVINNGDGSFTYVPDPGFGGSDSFDYQICDTDGA